MAIEQRVQRGQRARELDRQGRADDGMPGDRRAIERACDFLRWVEHVAAERLEADDQHVVHGHTVHRNANQSSSTKLTPNRTSAVGSCARITAYGSRSSSSATGITL